MLRLINMNISAHFRRATRLGAVGIVAVCLPIVAVAQRPANPSAAPGRYAFSQAQMGVPFKVIVCARDQGEARSAAQAAFDRVAELNQIFSDYEFDSELSRLSRSAGSDRWISVSDDLWEVLEIAREWNSKSRGAFDITIGPFSSLWRKARREKRFPESARLERARAAVGFEFLSMDAENRRVRLEKPRMRLDLGGLAKGRALDAALEVLRERGFPSAMVQAGGDIAVGDPPPGRVGWRVEVGRVEHPKAPPGRIVSLANQGFATSGDLFQHLEWNGVRYSHIVDPKTGVGLTNQCLISVIAPDAETADALATAISVLGPDAGRELVATKPDTSFHMVIRNGETFQVTSSGVLNPGERVRSGSRIGDDDDGDEFDEKSGDVPRDPATDFFDPEVIQTIHVRIEPLHLDAMNAALPERIYVPARFHWNETQLDNIGIRYKGNSSSGPNQRHKRSFLIKFNEFEKGRSFLGLKRVALDNGIQFGSLFSERLITDILRDLDIPAPRSNYARLMLNDEFHGIYVNVERIDSSFIERQFDRGDGTLFKVDEGGPGANWAFLGPVSGLYHKAFELKSGPSDRGYERLIALLRAVAEVPDEKFSATMESMLDLDRFLQIMAVMLFSGAFDQLTGWNPHNYYLYFEPAEADADASAPDSRAGRWHYLPWDLDVGFADNAFGRIPVLDGWHAAWPIPGGPPKPLLERIVDDPELLSRYRAHAKRILEDHFQPEALSARIDALYGMIREDLSRDPFPNRRATNPTDLNYPGIVQSIKDFTKRRHALAKSQLENPGPRPAPAPTPTPRPPRNDGRQRPEQPHPGSPSEDAPGDLEAVRVTASAVVLRWRDRARGEVGHIVQRSDTENPNGFRNHIGQPGDGMTTATDPHIHPGATYYYRVYAVHPTADGPRGTGVSNVISVTIPR